MLNREGEASKLEKWAKQKIDPTYEGAMVTGGGVLSCTGGMLIYDGKNFGYVLAVGGAALVYKGIRNLIRHTLLQKSYSEGFPQQD